MLFGVVAPRQATDLHLPNGLGRAVDAGRQRARRGVGSRSRGAKRCVGLLGSLKLLRLGAEGKAADLQLPDSLIGLVDGLVEVTAERRAKAAREQRIARLHAGVDLSCALALAGSQTIAPLPLMGRLHDGVLLGRRDSRQAGHRGSQSVEELRQRPPVIRQTSLAGLGGVPETV